MRLPDLVSVERDKFQAMVSLATDLEAATTAMFGPESAKDIVARAKLDESHPCGLDQLKNVLDDQDAVMRRIRAAVQRVIDFSGCYDGEDAPLPAQGTQTASARYADTDKVRMTYQPGNGEQTR